MGEYMTEPKLIEDAKRDGLVMKVGFNSYVYIPNRGNPVSTTKKGLMKLLKRKGGEKKMPMTKKARSAAARKSWRTRKAKYGKSGLKKKNRAKKTKRKTVRRKKRK